MRADAQANRDRILRAADEVFGVHGVEAPTEEVARHAGVGIATVFRHFPTKDDLVAAALVRHFEQVLDRARVLAQSEDPLAAFTDLVEAMAMSGAARSTLAGVLGELPEPARPAARALRAALGRSLRRAQTAGAVRSDVTVDQLHLLVRGLAAAAAAAGSKRATVRGAVAVVIAGVRA